MLGSGTGGNLRTFQIGDLIKCANEGWWGVIVGILPDPNISSLWFEIYCSETDMIRGCWDSQAEAI